MFEKLFLQLLNMSFTAGIVILFVLALRLLLKRGPRIYSYALWSVVLFRLLCPFSFESVLSLLPTKANPISLDIGTMALPEIDTGIRVINQVINTSLQTSIPTATPYASANPMQIWIGMGAWIWLMGALCLLGFSMVALLKLSKRLEGAQHYGDKIYLSHKIDTAFVMGVFRPRIYLPANLSETEIKYILRHEETHIQRYDHVIKLLGFFALCLHWFNPLVWLAFFLSTKDMEMSCDEAVIKKLGNEVKKDYSASLLTLATGRPMVGGTPLAFGEGDTKSRVENVLNYKKPGFWVIAISVILVAGLIIGLMANPIQQPADPQMTPQMEEIRQFRTNYVGDNSAVGNIAAKLSFPEELVGEGFQLYTENPPYGLTLYFKTDAGTPDAYIGASKEAPFKRNALILFSLIENVDYIEFTFNDGKNPDTLAYNRNWAQLFMDESDLFSRTETLEGFEGLMKEISAAINREVENGDGQSQGEQEPLIFFVKPDEPPEVIAQAALEIWRKSARYNPVPPEIPMATYEIAGLQTTVIEPINGENPAEMAYHYVIQVNYKQVTEAPSPQGNSIPNQATTTFSRLLYVKALEHGSFEIVKIGTRNHQ